MLGVGLPVHGSETFVVLWHLKVKQTKPYSCPCWEAEPQFLPTVVLLLHHHSFHEEVKIQTPKLKGNGSWESSCLEASLHFPVLLLQVTRAVKHERFPWPCSEQPEKSLFVFFWQRVLFWGQVILWVFCFCSVQKAFASSVQENTHQWIFAILILFAAKFHSSLDRKWRIPHSQLKGSQKLN